MCLIALAWKVDPRFNLVVAANRDEWRERPAKPLHWWEDHPRILAGRDLKAGGTWMGITQGGRFAAVTNFRDPSDKRSTAISRGTLVADFLLANENAETFLFRLAARADLFNGFNLVLFDGERLMYFGSHEAVPRPVEPGVHGLSNHLLDEPWPKVVRARRAMQAALAEADPVPTLFDLLADARGAEDYELPDTGVGLAWERRLAPPLITGADYGSRASTVATITAAGDVTFEERSLADDGSVAGIVRLAFRVS